MPRRNFSIFSGRHVILVLFIVSSLLARAEKLNDFNVNGIYYKIISDSTVAVAPMAKDKTKKNIII